jgi:hypothetical protein
MIIHIEFGFYQVRVSENNYLFHQIIHHKKCTSKQNRAIKEHLKIHEYTNP